MRRQALNSLLSLLLALAVLAALPLLSGCRAGNTGTEEQNLFVRVEAEGVYEIGVSTAGSSGGGRNADNSPIAPGDTLSFDLSPIVLEYTVTALAQDGTVLASGTFEDDFSGGATVSLTVTPSFQIQQNSKRQS